MILELLATVSLAASGVVAFLFLLNLVVYRRLPKAAMRPAGTGPALSVLLPARNEEANIRATVSSILANRDVEFELIVLDDHSTDKTASILEAMANEDPRVRLVRSPRLPPGWCGKQHACYVLSRIAAAPVWVFLDADVRLAPDALPRMLQFMRDPEVALASGVPRQRVKTFSEQLLIPLVHFILLGFLPMFWARRSRWPALGAGCGQLMVVRAAAYVRSGGHAAIRESLHDGLKLPRVFRQAGFKTELFDATDIAECRMYRTNTEVWHGLGKNAVEGLAAPGTIGPMSVLIFWPECSPSCCWRARRLTPGPSR